MVSLGIPVYNGAKYLEETLRSAQQQTSDDIEVVICDNASTDATQEISLDFVNNDPRFRYFRNDHNLGAARNWRRAFELTTGRYFKWLSSDDLIDSKYVERCAGALDEHPEAALCATLMPPIDANGHPLPYDETIGAWASPSGEQYKVWAAPEGLSSDDPVRRFDDVVHNLGGNMEGQFSFGLMRSSVQRRLPPYDLYLGAERVYQAQMALAGPWLYIDEPLSFRRIHDEHFGVAGVRQVITGLDPERTGLVTVPAARQLGGYVRAVNGANLTAPQRARCYASLARKVAHAESWKSIFLPGPSNYFGWGASRST